MKIIKSNEVFMKAKIIMCMTVIIPTVIVICRKLTMINDVENKLETWKEKMLSRI